MVFERGEEGVGGSRRGESETTKAETMKREQGKHGFCTSDVDAEKHKTIIADFWENAGDFKN